MRFSLSFLSLLSFLATLPAHADFQCTDDASSCESRLVKRVFLRLAAEPHSPVHQALAQISVLERYFDEKGAVPASSVSVVPYKTFSYTGKCYPDETCTEDEFDGTYWVFVGYSTGGRGSQGGSVRFECSAHRVGGGDITEKDVKCDSKYVDLGGAL